MKKFKVIKNFVYDSKDLFVNDSIFLNEKDSKLFLHYNYIEQADESDVNSLNESENVKLKNVDEKNETATVKKVTKRKN